jgi:hypothetical protein
MSQCKHPITAYRNRITGGLTFRPSDADESVASMTVPCGQCIGCRLERSRQWSVRIMHECASHERSSFLTMTYAHHHLPDGMSLDHRDVQLFFKRLRKHLGDKRVKYFVAGEYGEKLKRPHYHAILFGHWFPDAERFLLSESGHWLYRSDVLDRIWGKGHCQIGSVSHESAQYVAKYCLKKVTGSMAKEHYGSRKPEYATMSNGIGFEWIQKYVDEVYAHDEVIVNGHSVKPPRYYDKYLEKVDPEKFEEVKSARNRVDVSRIREQTPSRLEVQEKVLKARTSLYGDRSE